MSRLPLNGVRVVDLTWAAAGPYCTFLLALLGAEVIKVESASRPGLDRKGIVLSGVPGVSADINVNKRSVALNLKHPQGREMVLRLCAVSDLVVSNFRPGVLERLGLGYEDLRRANPAVVLVSISAHGLSGPEREGAGYAPIFAALGGASALTGYRDGPPAELRLPIDLVCGTMAAFAALSALLQARETGRGQQVEVANREVVSGFLGEYLLDALVNGRDPGRRGNQDEVMVPHNVYPCKGEGEWLAIAVGTEEEWQALCRVVGHPEWLEDPHFADPYRRWLHQEALDEALRAWCRERGAREAFHLLQEAGVPAGPSFRATDLLEDPHLRERGVFATVEGQGERPLVFPQSPWFYARTSWPVRRPPDLGEDTASVLGDLLGLDPSQVEDLVRTGVAV